MSRIIDRRLNGKNKSAVNRQRFLRRFKTQIKKAVSNAISGRKISDIEGGETITIPSKDISEPVIHHGQGGDRTIVSPGNKQFSTGDKIKRPSGGSGQGQGNKASNDGSGEDDFVFELSKEEFMEFFFEDLELPNLVKTKLATIYDKNRVRAGYTQNGVPTNINVVRSLRGAKARRIALRGPHKRKLKELEDKLEELLLSHAETDPIIIDLKREIEIVKKKISAIPFIDTFDLRYNNRIEVPKPTTQAAMICIMDVSGSMDQLKKELAKRFFILLYLFLTRNYEKIEIVFVCHHTTAREVDEQEFFYSRETGGTVVSSALNLAHDIISDRYTSDDWNVYVAQASDGDNWHDDSSLCHNIMDSKLLPLVQYFAYVEITPDQHQSLWHQYQRLRSSHPHFAMQQIDSAADIYPVFRELFKRQTEVKS
ncbi:MAG: YeaH/YhbH family protein [Gammaproteobacteria bacterium]|nr:YeaH/YhbH family protein [Gammaproteobacteria bacterium]